MNMKKVMKLTVAILLAITLITTFSICTFAATGYPNTTDFDNYNEESGASTSVANIIGATLTIVRIIGVGVAVIMLVVLAIKYISASPEGKGEIKKTATVYIVGAIVLFAASAILGIIQNFTKNIGAAETTSSMIRLILS